MKFTGTPNPEPRISCLQGHKRRHLANSLPLTSPEASTFTNYLLWWTTYDVYQISSQSVLGQPFGCDVPLGNLEYFVSRKTFLQPLIGSGAIRRLRYIVFTGNIIWLPFIVIRCFGWLSTHAWRSTQTISPCLDRDGAILDSIRARVQSTSPGDKT